LTSNFSLFKYTHTIN